MVNVGNLQGLLTLEEVRTFLNMDYGDNPAPGIIIKFHIEDGINKNAKKATILDIREVK